MEDFNYSEYPSQTLWNAIANAHWDIKGAKAQIRGMEKKLASRRGYSHQVLDNIAFHCRAKYKLIVVLESEIDDCMAELRLRGDNV